MSWNSLTPEQRGFVKRYLLVDVEATNARAAPVDGAGASVAPASGGGREGSPAVAARGNAASSAEPPDGAPAPRGDGPDGKKGSKRSPDLRRAEELEADGDEPIIYRSFPRWVPVARVMTNLEFSDHVDIALGMAPADAAKDNKDPENRVHPLSFEVTQAHVDAGGVLVIIVDTSRPVIDDDVVNASDVSFKDLSPEEKQAINDAANAAFWDRTGYKPGEELDPKDPNFEQMAAEWKKARAGLIQEQQKFEALPKRLMQFLKFKDGGVEITPAHYSKLLALAGKLQHLSDAELAAYWDRTDANTTDPDAFIASVERYIEEMRENADAVQERMEAKAALLGREKLYDVYTLARTPLIPTGGGPVDRGALQINEKIRAARSMLPKLLAKWDYANEAEFTQAMERYRVAFRDEAVDIAKDAMQRREHDLFEFETEVLNAESIEEMFSTLSKARDEHTRVTDGINTHPAISRLAYRPLVENAIKNDPGLKKLMDLRLQENPKWTLDDDTVDMLAQAKSAGELKASLQELLEERREGIRQTEALLDEDPEAIYRFDVAVERARVEGLVDENSIHDKILDAHLDEIQTEKLIKGLLLGAAAIGAGIVSGGTGTVAVLGAAAALGIGAYEAWETYKDYNEENAANLAGISSNDPSMAWAVLAIATLPLDAIGVGLAVKNMSKAARGAALAKGMANLLDEGGDVGKGIRQFNSALDKIDEIDDPASLLKKLETDLKSADTRVRSALLRRASAELAAAEAFARAMKTGGNTYAALDPLVTPALIYASKFAYPVFLWMRKGVIGFEQFLATRHARALVGKLDDIKAMENAGEVLGTIGKGYSLAYETAGDVALAARRLDMTDLELDMVGSFWSRHPNMSGKDIIAKLPIFRQARAEIGSVDELAKQGDNAARLAYAEKMAEAERIAAHAQLHGLSADDIQIALDIRAADPDISLEGFLDDLPKYKTDPEVPSPVTGRSSTVPREDGVVKPPRDAYNTDPSKANEYRIAAPEEVMDSESRRVLGQYSQHEDIAGTGAIENISARLDPKDKTAVEVTITGEPSPGALQRNHKKPLEDGQAYAPDFNSDNKVATGMQAKIKDLQVKQADGTLNALENSENWQRLHLWGPGFGDEAAAGMFLGPKEVNLAWQNAGIEDKIRELARQVAPHKDAGYRVKVTAKSRSWGRPTPKGFELENGEAFLKEASYEIALVKPDGTIIKSRVDLTVQTDPGDINLGLDPGVHVGFSDQPLIDLFAALPTEVADVP